MRYAIIVATLMASSASAQGDLSSKAQPQVSEQVRQQLEAQRAQQAARVRQRPPPQPQNSQGTAR